VRAYLDDAIGRQEPELATLTQVNKGHGRMETRRYWQGGAIGWFADRGKWAGLHSVGVVEAGRMTTVERRYYLSSRPAEVATCARAVRGHWAVEANCTGRWTWSSARTRAKCTPATPWPTSADCAGTTPDNVVPRANSSTPPSSPTTPCASSKTPPTV
jgi:hypothetical protein